MKPTLLRELKPVTGYELFQWPERRALLDRLGVPPEFPALRLAIDSGGINDLVTITHHHQAVDASAENLAMVEISNMHNRMWATWMPSPAAGPKAETPSVPHPDKLL